MAHAHAPNCTDPDNYHRGVCRTDRRQMWVVTELSLRLSGPLNDGERHPERTPVGPFDSRDAADQWAAAQVRHYGGDGSWSCAPIRPADRHPQSPAGVDEPGGSVAPAGLSEAVNVALSVWSNTCNAYCDEEDRTHERECLLASDLYERLRNFHARSQAVAPAGRLAIEAAIVLLTRASVGAS
jgi:hypothetical protein